MSELELLRNNFHEAASNVLKSTHIEYVELFLHTLKETISNNPDKAHEAFTKATEAVKDISTDKGFARWRPILTAELDVEIALNRLRVALNAFGKLPPKDFLDACLLSEGDWVDYNYSNCIILMKSVIEKERTLICRVTRELVRPTETNWKEIETRLLQNIDRMNKEMGDIRDPMLHGGHSGSDLTVLEIERHWENNVLLGVRNLVPAIVESFVANMDKWHERISWCALRLVNEIEDISKELNYIIAWDYL